MVFFTYIAMSGWTTPERVRLSAIISRRSWSRPNVSGAVRNYTPINSLSIVHMGCFYKLKIQQRRTAREFGFIV